MSALRSPLAPIFLTVFVDVLGLTLILPLLPFYALHFGATPLQVGLLAASYAAFQLVSGPILGRVSDRAGRRPTLLASQLGTFLGFLVMGFADSLWMLFLSRIIDGLTAGNLSIAQAYISDVTKPENRTRAFGFIGIAFGTGFVLGPMISGPLAHRIGYAAPAFAAAGLSMLSILATALVLREPPKPADEAASDAAAPAGRRTLELGRFLRRPLPRRRLIELFAFVLSFSTLLGGLALYLERRFRFNVEQTGYVYGLSGLVGALVQGGAIGRLVKHLGEERLALVGLVCMAGACAAMGAAHAHAFLYGIVVVSSFGAAVVRPSLTTLLTKSVGQSEQGAALGTSQSLASIAQITGPVIAGWLIGREQLAAYGLAAGLFAAVGALLLWWGNQIPRGDPAA